MNKKNHALWASTIIAISLSLSGCQLLTGYQTIGKAENAKTRLGDIHPIDGEVNIACVGTYHCEIVQIDKTLVINPESHKPVNPQMVEASPTYQGHVEVPLQADLTPHTSKGVIKIVPLATSAMPDLTNYYARFMPAKHEIHVNFYPENNMGYVERFAMIHDFVDSGTYQLRAYQKKASNKSGSLLETASPEPLCIELIHSSVVQRRFCKQLDTERQGEFVETGLIEAAS